MVGSLGMPEMLLMWLFPLIWLAVVGYVFYLATRLVSAVETIARAVDKQ